MVPVTIRRLWTALPPHVDGIDHTIALLTVMREASLEAADRVEGQGGAVEDLRVVVPAEALDGLVLQLTAARDYREQLRRSHHSLCRVSMTLAGIGFGLALLSLGLQLL